MIIFGWGGGTPKDFGPTVPGTCPNCQNRTVFHYCKSTKWFRLFFIPVFRYDTQHLLVCPVCTRSTSLSSEQGAQAKELADAHASWYGGNITDEEYADRASRFLKSAAPIESVLRDDAADSAYGVPAVISSLPPRDFAPDAEWGPDPTGRHEQRFWDGSSWTAYVWDNGTTRSDSVLNPGAKGWYPDPARRNDSRYWDGRNWTEHVESGGTPGTDPLESEPS